MPDIEGAVCDECGSRVGPKGCCADARAREDARRKAESRAKDCEEKHGVVLGVGDGSGRLFVYGDYDSIVECRRMVLAARGAPRPVTAWGASGVYWAAPADGDAKDDVQVVFYSAPRDPREPGRILHLGDARVYLAEEWGPLALIPQFTVADPKRSATR